MTAPKYVQSPPLSVWRRVLPVGSYWVVSSTLDPRGFVGSLEETRPLTFRDDRHLEVVVRRSSKTRLLSGPFESRGEAQRFRRKAEHQGAK